MDKPETAAERDEREAEILAGEIPVELSGGRKVVVREIRWLESLRLGAQLRTIIAQVAKRTAEGKLEPRAIFEIPEDHPEEFLFCMSLVTDVPESELAEMDLHDGEKLESAFWKQNTAFFARQVGRILSAARTVDLTRALETSTQPLPEKSSPPSPETGTTPSA